jgi:hypothetical protein
MLDLARVEGNDDVVLLATTQGVMHQVAVGADPDAGGVPLQVDREVGAIDYRAIDHMPRHPRRVADELLAHDRLHTVGADQGAAPMPVAVFIDRGDAVRVLLDARHPGGGEELDAAALAHALEQ